MKHDDAIETALLEGFRALIEAGIVGTQTLRELERGDLGPDGEPSKAS
jgi:hypothetical protein